MIEGMEMHVDGLQTVKAKTPLGEMFGYATRLRSMTQGRGIFTMEFSHYSPVSEDLAREVLRGYA